MIFTSMEPSITKTYKFIILTSNGLHKQTERAGNTHNIVEEVNALLNPKDIKDKQFYILQDKTWLTSASRW